VLTLTATVMRSFLFSPLRIGGRVIYGIHTNLGAILVPNGAAPRLFGCDGKPMRQTSEPMPGTVIKFSVEGKAENGVMIVRRIQIVELIEETF
jgi:hypothetical protein